jgi:predicted flavoprotein YhiN
VGVKVNLTCNILSHSKNEAGQFNVETSMGNYQTQSLVIATGGLSLPKMGASPFAYKVAAQYQLSVKTTRAGLVPFTLHQQQKEKLESLSGISLPAAVTYEMKVGKKSKQVSFSEALLFTHRGLSGPVILQYQIIGKLEHR